MADALEGSRSTSDEQAGERAFRRPAKDYRHRFRLAYVALALVFWGIVAGVAIVATGGIGGDEGPAWSAWKPEEKGIDAAREIAAHVGGRYHLQSGRQLVAVQASEPEIQNVPLEAVAVRGGSGGDVTVISAKNSVVYVLCGLGARCAINVGKPSEARARLLRREALELALYTFKYVKGVDSVIAFLPPPPNQKPPSWSVFFRKSELKPELKQPLRATLPDARPPTAAELKPAESDTIERLTRQRWFKSEFQQAQDGGAILVLDPLTASS